MSIYSPAEDSFLLAKEVLKYLKKLKNLNIKILDMGSGSGIQATTAMRAGIERKNILCADIDKEAIAFLKKSGLNRVHSNLFSKIKKMPKTFSVSQNLQRSKQRVLNQDFKIKNKYSLIIFNAPYLPEDKYDKEIDTTAGKKGYEIIIKFLKQAKQHLEKEGVILLLFSSLSKPNIILKQAKKLGYNSEKLSEENMGMMETIFVYRFSKN